MKRFKYLRRNPEPVYDENYKKMIKRGGFKVKFTLKPENGEFTSEIKGIEGKSCQKVVENVINEMGLVLDATPTEEYFEQPKEEAKAKVRPPISTTELPMQNLPFKRKEGKQSEIQKEKEKQQRRLLRRARRNPRLRGRRNPYSFIDPWARLKRF